MDTAERGEKLSASKSVGFRVGPLRGEIDELHRQLLKENPQAKLSDIMRDGFVAFWPQIKAFTLARHQTKIDAPQLAKITVISAKAMENGITAEEVEECLSDLFEAKLRPASRA